MTTLEVQRALREPPDRVGQALLDLEEDQWFERKSTRIAAADVANGLCGMANADGGSLVVGLWNGEVEGTDAAPKRRNDQMQAVVDFTRPPVRAPSRLVPCVN